MDVELADFDGDFDIDIVVSSRNSQSRVFMNNLYSGVSASPFQDVTQTALVDTGAVQTLGWTYDVEFADFDGDGDFDLWMDNYSGLAERILRNDGFVQGVGFSFTAMQEWIQGDPSGDEENVEGWRAVR